MEYESVQMAKIAINKFDGAMTKGTYFGFSVYKRPLQAPPG
jgi:hypothetical protein